MVTDNYQILCQKIISGGQTGVDRGTLDACLAKNFPTGGWCPLGRLAEDGVIHKKYPLLETKTSDYETRTKKNVFNSDGTLIISPPVLSGGTLLTEKLALEYKKPVLVISPNTNNHSSFVMKIKYWLIENKIETLNVAGPRESEWNMGFRISFSLISNLIYEINKSIS